MKTTERVVSRGARGNIDRDLDLHPKMLLPLFCIQPLTSLFGYNNLDSLADSGKACLQGLNLLLSIEFFSSRFEKFLEHKDRSAPQKQEDFD